LAFSALIGSAEFGPGTEDSARVDHERLPCTTTTTLAAIQHITMPHIDEHLNGIREEFDRLNHELDETRKQRDEYITKCTS